MTDRVDRKIQQSAASEMGPQIGRRDFFGVTIGMTAAGLVGGGALPAFAVENGDERTKARYQANSAHVKEFYHVNRYVWPKGK